MPWPPAVRVTGKIWRCATAWRRPFSRFSCDRVPCSKNTLHELVVGLRHRLDEAGAVVSTSSASSAGISAGVPLPLPSRVKRQALRLTRSTTPVNRPLVRNLHLARPDSARPVRPDSNGSRHSLGGCDLRAFRSRGFIVLVFS